jgi:hypothetical protein
MHSANVMFAAPQPTTPLVPSIANSLEPEGQPQRLVAGFGAVQLTLHDAPMGSLTHTPPKPISAVRSEVQLRTSVDTLPVFAQSLSPCHRTVSSKPNGQLQPAV